MTQQLVNSPHLDSRHGTVLTYQPGSARYQVQLQSNISDFITGDSRTTPVAIKPENLLQTGVKVKIHGLQSEPWLNRNSCQLLLYLKEENDNNTEVGSEIDAIVAEVSNTPWNEMRF